MLLYVLDLFGVAVFAASGALAGIAAHFDLLGERPVFWIRDSGPIYTILAATAATLVWVHYLPVPTHALLVADAIGLAVFAVSGAQVAEKAGCRPLVVVLMGTLTGAGGGVLRDILSAKLPLILHQDIYASAAIAGITVYLLSRAARLPTATAFAAGFVTVMTTRLAAIAFDLHLPVFTSPP